MLLSLFPFLFYSLQHEQSSLKLLTIEWQIRTFVEMSHASNFKLKSYEASKTENEAKTQNVNLLPCLADGGG